MDSMEDASKTAGSDNLLVCPGCCARIEEELWGSGEAMATNLVGRPCGSNCMSYCNDG